VLARLGEERETIAEMASDFSYEERELVERLHGSGSTEDGL